MEEFKGASSAATSTPAMKGIIIQEKRIRDEVPDVTPGKMVSKGKEVMPPLEDKKKAKSTPSEAEVMEITRPVAPGEGTSSNPIVALGLKVTKECCHGRKTPRVVSKLFHILG